MVEKSHKIVALLDYTKIGTSSIATFATTEEIDTLVVDHELTPEIRTELDTRGIKVL